MAEVYPSESELLDLLSESETGVEYIPTGTAPYYLQFRKLLYRLLLATKRANDFRLYDEGGLTFGVKPGKFWDGNQLVEYAGSSGNIFADDKATIFVYVDSDGVLNFTQYSLWPFIEPANHVRLAIVTTNSGDITSIVDCRDHHSMAMPRLKTEVVEEVTADVQIEHRDTGKIFTNKGATGTVTISLPSFAEVVGTKYKFVVQAAEEFRVDPVAGAIIDVSGQTASKYKSSLSIGYSMTIVSDGSGDWIVTDRVGTWSEEA